MGFGSSIVFLVLLDEGQVVEDGGKRRVRLAVDLAGLDHAGVEHAASLGQPAQLAQHQPRADCAAIRLARRSRELAFARNAASAAANSRAASSRRPSS